MPCAVDRGGAMYSSSDIANYFLQRARSEGRALTPMQLHKLVYIAHGWSLGYGRGKLIGERIEAGPFGPVVPDLYHRIKHYGGSAVTEPVPQPIFYRPHRLDEETTQLLDAVWRGYSNYSGIQLSTITHQSGSPWDQVYRRGGLKRNVPIDDEIIAEYYRQFAAVD